MPAVSLVVNPYLHNNRAITDGPHNRDDGLRPFILLAEILAKHGITLATDDLLPPNAADARICIDVQHGYLPPEGLTATSLLVVYEPPLHAPETFTTQTRKRFHGVYTWEDDKVDGAHTHLLKYGMPWPTKTFNIEAALEAKTTLACTISGYKKVNAPGELYSAREDVIRWYETYAPADFNLYGIGWDKHTFTGLMRPLNRLPAARKLMAPRWPLWRGPVDNKGKVLAAHKFAFAYENLEGLTGYITEKPFDVLFAGTVPVYRGAPNVLDYIPGSCILLADDFKNLGELHRHLKGMSDTEYRTYLENIATFITGNKKGPFSAWRWATTLCDAVLEITGETK
ncbi:MAG: hypothetical protein H6922_01615 [Pseudomonadaceae bacterium]|nr:hypothetical protein [Pseudomonadaceae bacterium]